MNPSSDRLLDLLGDSLKREVLALTSEEARSAEVVAERCEASLPTVYRHIDDLQEVDLLEEADRYDEEGNHYKVYRAALDHATVRVEGGEVRTSTEHADWMKRESPASRPTPDGVEHPDGAGPE